jgi:hypothetical protein
MIPLNRDKFPGSTAELAAAMDESLRQYVQKEKPLVTIKSRVFPYLDEIAINFDGAQLDSNLPEPAKSVGETKLACEAALVSLSARKVSLHGAPVNLQLEARNVVFHEGRDNDNKLLLLIHSARTGNLLISAAQLDLENAIGEMAKKLARKQGITIEETRVAFRARGPRSISADVRLSAKKLLFRTKIDLAGQIHVSDDFIVKISNLTCRGDGPIGSLACGVLDPQLRKLEGTSFSLMSLPLGEIQLRDIRIAVADSIEITADFGSAAS